MYIYIYVSYYDIIVSFIYDSKMFIDVDIVPWPVPKIVSIFFKHHVVITRCVFTSYVPFQSVLP